MSLIKLETELKAYFLECIARGEAALQIPIPDGQMIRHEFRHGWLAEEPS